MNLSNFKHRRGASAMALAAALAFSSVARAADPKIFLPPAEFRFQFHGTIRINRVTQAGALQACSDFGFAGPHGCAAVIDGICEIYRVDPVLDPSNAISEANVARLAMHEMGHCNGWGTDNYLGAP